ncbi:hypothetical protein C4B63_35g103 [Trypanosoma cruzi]|uniref:Uncharacterized protein n=1 Tax=Trypanosoma cruzi TaxID=5693 RepID=A0A2V2VEJ4_TRYCR|nr:hypothetical protein C4B63_35g103 [Trypanosoma cruzi]
MKIKKKELRRREAQLPINYPHPEVTDASVSVEAATFKAEETRVEAICRRLAHNEVAVRDAVLAELPRYIRSVTQRLVGLEACVDVAALRRFIVMQSGGKGGRCGTSGGGAGGEKRVVINVLRELEAYRNRGRMHDESKDVRRQFGVCSRSGNRQRVVVITITGMITTKTKRIIIIIIITLVIRITWRRRRRGKRSLKCGMQSARACGRYTGNGFLCGARWSWCC